MDRNQIPKFTFQRFARSRVAERNIGSACVEVLAEVPVVLVVEDDQPLQDIIHEALKDGGFDLLVTVSGEEALTLLGSGVFKCSAVVTDINLEGRMDGWEVARQSREINPAFAIVYITGAAAGRWPSRGVPNSILLEKPFAPAQLVTAVSRLLNAGTPTQ